MAAASQEIAASPVKGTTRKELWPLAPASWLKFAVLALMLAMIAALLWLPLRRVGSDSQINYNEGWNAYKQTLARDGFPLYGAPPNPLTGPTTYPPVSFHLIGGLARLRHSDVVRTGRWVSLFALLAAGVFIGLIVGELRAGAVVAGFSALLYLLGIAIFLPDRLGMNDPQLLGEAFTAAGLYFYLKGRCRVRWLVASALLFCLGGFTKQNLLAFPAAAGLDLLLRSRKGLAIWLGAMVGFAALLTGLTLALDGRYFLTHLLFHRTYSLDDAITSATQYYLVSFQGIILVSIVWLICRGRRCPLLTTAFLFANALAFTLAGGDGVDLNIYFNAFAAGVLICGIAVAEFGGEGGRQSVEPAMSLTENRPSGIRSAALMLALLLCLSVGFPDRIATDRARAQEIAGEDAEFQAAVRLLRAAPGPALCENLLLCYRAGKPYLLDTFVAGDQLDAGALDRDAIPAMLRNRKFGSVELDTLPQEAVSASAPLVRNRPRFSQEWIDALLQNYKLEVRNPHVLIFLPK